MRCHVDVGALLLTTSDRHHEPGIGHRHASVVLNHDRPVGPDQYRPTLAVSDGQRVGGNAGYIGAVLDDVDARVGLQCAEVDVLIAGTALVAGTAANDTSPSVCQIPASVETRRPSGERRSGRDQNTNAGRRGSLINRVSTAGPERGRGVSGRQPSSGAAVQAVSAHCGQQARDLEGHRRAEPCLDVVDRGVPRAVSESRVRVHR